MKGTMSVEEYIEKHPQFQKEMEFLRSILLKTDLDEAIKWGAPCYVLDGKMVVGMVALKSYVALWFHQGVFLSDPQHKLINAQEGVTKALRQWRFSSTDEMDRPLIEAYVLEAIRNQREGKGIKPERKKMQMPAELGHALKEDARLKTAFEQFTPGKQREFAEYVSEAKREETRVARVAKIAPMILAGVGLNDKYKG